MNRMCHGKKKKSKESSSPERGLQRAASLLGLFLAAVDLALYAADTAEDLSVVPTANVLVRIARSGGHSVLGQL